MVVHRYINPGMQVISGMPAMKQIEDVLIHVLFVVGVL